MRKKPLPSEAAVAAAVVAYLRETGWDIYQEVDMGKRADIVARRGPVLMVVETKLTMSLKFLDQVLDWVGYANMIVAVSYGGRIGRAAHSVLKSHGIGYWWVRDYGEQFRVEEEVQPQFIRKRHDRLLNALRPEQMTGEWAAAGTTGGGYFSPFTSTCRTLSDIVAKNPGIELRAALDTFRHHYSSTKSAMGSLPVWIRKGKVPNVELHEEGRRLRLYPAGWVEAHGVGVPLFDGSNVQPTVGVKPNGTSGQGARVRKRSRRRAAAAAGDSPF
jgi:hypothetical protein